MAKKILIADQSDAIRSVAVNIMRQRGHEVLTASAGPEAWEIIKSGKIDLAILNSSLPTMNGYSIAKMIKEDSRLKSTKVLLLLSHSEIVNQHQLITAQPDGTMNKPFAPPDLMNRAAELLGEKPVSEENAANHQLQSSVSEMDLDQDQIAEEIDFESVFADEEKSDGNDVHLTEILADEVKEEDSSSSDLEELTGEEKKSEVTQMGDQDKKNSSADDPIRLADDQYGLEEPFEPPEVETPHDYNWFIREMKNEIENKPKATADTAQARAETEEKDSGPNPADRGQTTGHFTVEEIGTSKVQIDGSKSDKNEPQELYSDASKPDHQVPSDDSKLALAEKLLIKELARRLAEKIVQQIPRENLNHLLDDILSELKKY